MKGIVVDEPVPGSRVRIPLGVDQVEAEVAEVYGPPARRHVLVWLTPELSDAVVAEPTTVSIPLERVIAAPSGT